MTKLDRIISRTINVVGAFILIFAVLDVALTLGLSSFIGLVIGLVVGGGMLTFKIEGR